MMEYHCSIPSSRRLFYTNHSTCHYFFYLVVFVHWHWARCWIKNAVISHLLPCSDRTFISHSTITTTTSTRSGLILKTLQSATRVNRTVEFVKPLVDIKEVTPGNIIRNSEAKWLSIFCHWILDFVAVLVITCRCYQNSLIITRQ